MTGKSPTGAYEIVKTTLGVTSIKDLSTGEILHNPVGPWAESHDLYVTGMRLKEKLAIENPKPLVLFDVGLGAGFNAAAALSAFFEERARGRRLHIVSFEYRLELLKFTLNHIGEFPFLERHRDLMENFLSAGRITTESGLTWELRRGPFEKLLMEESLSPDVVFFDPYSPKTNPEMWSFSVVRKLFELSRDTILATYSMSTAVRTTFLMAGFFVGAGPRSGAKSETTLASTRLEELAEPLGARWLERWMRSKNPLPLGLPEETVESVRAKILNHPQFLGLKRDLPKGLLER